MIAVVEFWFHQGSKGYIPNWKIMLRNQQKVPKFPDAYYIWLHIPNVAAWEY
jgi:hypothetical protein